MSRKLPPFRMCNQCNQTKPVDQFHKYVQPRERGRTTCSYSKKCLACRAEIEIERGERAKYKLTGSKDREIIKTRAYEKISDEMADEYRWFIEREIPLPLRRGDVFIWQGQTYKTMSEIIQQFNSQAI